MRIQFFGQEHLAVAGSLNNLKQRSFCRTNTSWPRPKVCSGKLVEMQRKLLGNAHPSLATVLNNYALTLQAEGRLADAEAAFREALEIRRKKFGDDHPSVTSSLRDLNNVLALEWKNRKILPEIHE